MELRAAPSSCTFERMPSELVHSSIGMSIKLWRISVVGIGLNP